MSSCFTTPNEPCQKILNQQVAADFGIYNVGFEGGFAMYKKALFQELVDGLDIVGKSNSFVLYFEVENLAELEEEIVRNGFEFIHKTREQPWKQRVFRFYDYDNHIVEIAEKMDAVSHRLYQEGKTIEEISELTGMPVNQVLQQINKYKGMD